MKVDEAKLRNKEIYK